MKALFILLEDKIELLKLYFENLDVLSVSIALLLELVDLRCELPFVLFAVLDLTQRT